MAVPNQITMVVSELPITQARWLAEVAVVEAYRNAPKLSGDAAKRLRPIYGEGFFGISWQDDYLWYQNQGTSPFTMTKLAGKVIPMWIDDPTGTERAKNPKAKRRVTASGRIQILIFRRAAKIGARKTVKRKVAGKIQETDVPASYPGAPGRIAVREAARPWTTQGKVGGQIARSNVGVRWRHPGLAPRRFLENGLHQAAHRAGVVGVIHAYSTGA